MTHDISISLLELGTIERELKALSERKIKQWQRIASLLLIVSKNDLYEPEFPSFTKWLEQFARSVGMHPSSFWRYKEAAQYFLEKTGLEIEQFELTHVSQPQFK